MSVRGKTQLTWYWHRLRAMRFGEMLRHARRRWYQCVDRRYPANRSVALGAGRFYPSLPDRQDAPASLKEVLGKDLTRISQGRWRAFGQLDLRVDTPPKWHRDYLAGCDLPTQKAGSQLNHRALPHGADVKLIWELSRWTEITRLAMAAHVCRDGEAAKRCVGWLEDWREGNPPFRGWNWTSALETGIRLIQLSWLDALLELPLQGAEEAGRWATLRDALVPAHVHYTWHHRSFGSSANNHLLGELAGLVTALTRWPALRAGKPRLDAVVALWEQEVLRQFAEDGGNREQALNYQLFSWELCWHARAALKAQGRSLSHWVEARLSRAADFFATVQVAEETWDYGDSDGAFVLPLALRLERVPQEWQQWLNQPESSPGIHYWMGNPPAPAKPPACHIGAGDWLMFPDSGVAVCWSGDWHWRWDATPLGYLATAAHGHLDALHLSLWYRGQAMVVDPGTGAYYGDLRLRRYLASWEAHNGPHPLGAEFPERQGPFLWRAPHEVPVLRKDSDDTMAASLRFPEGQVRRLVRRMPPEEGNGWQVNDTYEADRPDLQTPFRVCWQFAPGTELEHVSERIYRVTRQGVSLQVGLDSAWREVEMVRPAKDAPWPPGNDDFRGVCSPGFRRVQWGPQLRLTAPGHNPCLFRTTFLACSDS